MIVPLTTILDPVRGLLLVYKSSNERRYMSISPEQNMRWKRWLRRAKVEASGPRGLAC